MPYGKDSIKLNILDSKNTKLLEPKHANALNEPIKEFILSLDNPINSEPLSEIIRKKKGQIIIVVDDHTRKTPHKLILPPLLKYLLDNGAKKQDIKFLIASGYHSAPNKEQLNDMFDNFLNDYEILINDQNTSQFINLGKTSLGNSVYINSEYINASVKILITDVMLHYFAGFGGGRKSIMPGVAGKETINYNHQMTTLPEVKPGKLDGNPIHEDMLESARMAGADFVVNLCMNSDNKLFAVKSGALNDAFREAVKVYKEYYVLKVDKQADLLILSQGGYPFDINYYQSLKSLHLSHNAVKPNGKILFFTECSEKMGNNVFIDCIEQYNDKNEVMEFIKTDFNQGANSAYYQYKYSEDYQISIHTTLEKNYVETKLKMNYADNPQKVLDELIKESNLTYIVKDGGKLLVEFN